MEYIIRSLAINEFMFMLRNSVSSRYRCINGDSCMNITAAPAMNVGSS